MPLTYYIASSRSYFTQSEMNSFDFCTDKTENKRIYTDYHTSRYLSAYAGKRTTSNINPIINPTDEIQKSYMLFRKNHLDKRDRLSFTIGKTGFMGINRSYTKEELLNKENVLEQCFAENKIYDNNENLIFGIN